MTSARLTQRVTVDVVLFMLAQSGIHTKCPHDPQEGAPVSIMRKDGSAAFDDPVTEAALCLVDEDGIETSRLTSDLVDPDEPAVGAIHMALLQARGLGFDIQDEAIAAQVIAAARRQHANEMQSEHLRGARNQARLELRQHQPVVYYMRVGNRVKIGFTTNLTARIAQVMPEEVLTTEPGGRLLEDVRHRQFADLRVAREWFRLEGPLIGHIACLAEAAA